MQNASRGAPQASTSHASLLGRRIMSVLSGLVSLALVPVVLAVHRDDYLEAPVTIYVGLVLVAFGVAAAVLWFPKNHAAVLRKILIGVVTLVVVYTAVILFFVAGVGTFG